MCYISNPDDRLTWKNLKLKKLTSGEMTNKGDAMLFKGVIIFPTVLM